MRFLWTGRPEGDEGHVTHVDPLTVGQRVRVTALEGLTLTVMPADTDNS